MKILISIVLMVALNASCEEDVMTIIQENDDALVAVAVMFRHGDRSPEVSFPKDNFYRRSYWPMGFAQLTKSGIQRQYNLGRWFRKRYSSFLSETYSPEEIYVVSTNTDRTLMSATVNLAGLYPPKNYQVWNEQIPWQPIPVHTEDRSKDDIITEKRSCRKFNKAYRKLKRSRLITIEKENAQLFGEIKNRTGWKHVSLENVKTLQRTFQAYKHYNESFIPQWYKDMDENAIMSIAAVSYATATATTALARLRIGPFFNYLFNHFDHFTNPSSLSKAKFLMLSAHDSSVSSVLGGMGAFRTKPVGFADTIIWELKKTSEGSYYLNVFYKADDDLEGLSIYDCDLNCDYEVFKEFLSNITVDIQQWKIDCDNKKH